MKQALILLTVAACSKSGGGGSENETVLYQHDKPAFKLQVPANLSATNGSNGLNVSLHNGDSTQEVMVMWEQAGSENDLMRAFERHGKEADLTKIVEQGPLAGGKGKYISLLRDQRTYVYAVVTSGAFGVECSAHGDDPKAAYLGACKTLLPE